MSNLINLFVGCDPNGNDAEQQMVLEYSLLKNCSLPFQITWMRLNNDPTSPWYHKKWNTTKWATPFSGFRWSIPEACDFKGKAIYCDADFIFLKDLKYLWEQEFESGKAVMGKGGGSWRFCLAFWNNPVAMLHITGDKLNPDYHSHNMGYFSSVTSCVQPFVGNWNCIDGEGLPIKDIHALHYSSMSHQLSHKYSVPRLSASKEKHWFDGHIMPHPRKELQDLYDKLYSEALKEGLKVEDYIPKEPLGAYEKESQKDYKGGNQYVT